MQKKERPAVHEDVAQAANKADEDSAKLQGKHFVMRRLTFVVLLAALFALVHVMPAAAETEDDAKAAQVHQEHPEFGFLFFDVTVLREGKPEGCASLSAILTSNTGKKVEVDIFTSVLSFKGKTHGALASLEPAVWTIALVNCYKHLFKGPFAQIRVESGEIINAGNLVFAVYKVEDLRPETIESLKKRAPGTFAKAKRRYFGINPTLK
jgi:hypothetical protein